MASLLLVPLMLMPVPTAAGPANLTVIGYVYDNAGTPLEGADILVEVRAGSFPTRSATTDEDGFYLVDFDLADWQIGDTVRTTATYNTVEEFEEGVADGSTVVNLDIHFAFEIPEFGSLLGVLAATMLMGTIAVFSVRRRKAE